MHRSLSVLLVLFTSSAAHAQTTFTSRSAWEAAIGGTSVEGFELDPVANSPTPYTSSRAWSFASLGTPITVQVLDGGSIDGSREMRFRDFGQQMQLTFPGGEAQTAFGFDYDTGVEAWELRIGGSLVANLPASTTGFIGVTSASPSSDFVLTSPAQAQSGIAIDRLTVPFNSYFEGLSHTALGLARLEDQGEALVVHNLGSSGLDGVRIALGESDGWGFTIAGMDPLALPVGAFKQWTMYAFMNGQPDQPAWTERHEVGPNGTYVVVLDTSPMGATLNRLDIYDDGELVYSDMHPNGPLYTFFSSGGGTPPPIGVAAVWDATCVVRPIDPNLWPIRTADGTVITSYDVIETYAYNPTTQPSFFSAVESLGADIGQETLFDEVLVVLDNPHEALGNARLGTPSAALRVSNLGSSGQDGVRVHLGEADSATVVFVPLDPQNTAPVGSTLTTSARGRLNGVDDQSLGEFVITKASDGTAHDFQLDVDFGQIGSPTYRLQLFQGGAPVLDLPGQTGIVGFLSSWPRKNGKLGGEVECFTSCPPAGGTIDVGGTVYAYDEMNVLAEGAGGVEFKTDLDLRATGLAEFIVISEDIVPFDDTLGTAYCVGALNSAGLNAAMSAAGSAVTADNDFTLETSGLPGGVPGVYFFGPNQVQIPFGDGFRCVGGMTSRIQPPAFAMGNNASRLVDLTAFGINPGDSLNFQFWYRDSMAMMSGFNLSNGLNVVFQ